MSAPALPVRRAGPAARTVPAPAVLVGVDALEIARVRGAVVRNGPVYAARICSAAERGPLAPGALGLAARLAVKECLIKAIGGRPPAFDWHDLQVLAPGDGDPVAPVVTAPVVTALAAALGSAFRATGGPVLGHRAAVRLSGPCATAAAAALHDPDDVAAGAAWGHDGVLLVAVAVVAVGGAAALPGLASPGPAPADRPRRPLTAPRPGGTAP